MLKELKSQSIVNKVMLSSDFIEYSCCSFCAPIYMKGIYSSDSISSRVIALGSILSYIATIIWNNVWNEKRRYNLFKKTYLVSVISYALCMCCCALIGLIFKDTLLYWSLNLMTGLIFGRLFSQGNQELFGNLFSTEDRKTYERLDSSIVSMSCILGSGIAVIFSLSLWSAIVIWCLTYICDAVSMSFVFIYGIKHDMLLPRVQDELKER